MAHVFIRDIEPPDSTLGNFKARKSQLPITRGIDLARSIEADPLPAMVTEVIFRVSQPVMGAFQCQRQK